MTAFRLTQHLARGFFAALLLPAVAGGEPLVMPDRIVLVVPYPPGGPSDRIARVLAAPLAEALGASVSVENRSGEGGADGTRTVALAPPDGAVLLIGTAGTMAALPATQRDLAYDPDRDFEPVALLATAPLLVLVNAAVPAKNLDELIRHARANPGRLRFGASVGGVTWLAGRMLARMANVGFRFVPYDGSGPQLYGDLADGRIDLALESATLPLLHDSRVRVIAVTGQLRLSSLPQVPTVSEAGIPGFDATSWTGLFAPRGTPSDLTRRIGEAVATVLARPEVTARLADAGVAARPSTPDQLRRMARADRAKWTREADIARRGG